MNFQLPIPSFDDFRKLLQFWTDQEDKWFYFEIGTIRSGSTIISEVRDMTRAPAPVSYTRDDETSTFLQDRVVGEIHDVIPYPPSLLLKNATIFTVSMSYESISYQKQMVNTLVSTEKRNKYGLVFSQITYYEPIENIMFFLNNDKRVNVESK